MLSDNADTYDGARRLTAAELDTSLQTLASASGGVIGHLDMLMLERPAGSPLAIRGQWHELCARRKQGACRSLGLCNFDISEVDACLAAAREKRSRPQVSGIQRSRPGRAGIAHGARS